MTRQILNHREHRVHREWLEQNDRILFFSVLSVSSVVQGFTGELI